MDPITRGGGGGDSGLVSPIEHVPQRMRLAMALMPAFTVPALDAIGTTTPPLTDVLRQLDQRGLIEADPGAIGTTPAPSTSRRKRAPVPAIRLGSELSTQILAPYLSTSSTRAGALRAECAAIAQLLTDPSRLPDVTRKWCELASVASDSETLVHVFDERIEDASHAGDSANLVRWMECAQSLSAILQQDQDGSLALALQRAGRQLELLARERGDRRHLETFYPRRMQIDRLTNFIEGPLARWQLHLLGPGGVGKTMLVRHFTLEMAERLGFVCARVDFDFLNPDYPRLDPGLLLWSLSRELRLRDKADLATKRFKAADAIFKSLRDELRRGANLPASGRPTDHPLFREVIWLFNDALSTLPTPDAPKPVVLVLDTCEELVKGRARGGGIDGVSETFRILGALKHGPRYLDDEQPRGDGVARLRVLFAGRRPLAREGDEGRWTCEATTLAPRPELDVFELQGFSSWEADDWMRSEFAIHDQRMIDAVIKATPRVRAAVRIVRAAEPGAREAAAREGPAREAPAREEPTGEIPAGEARANDARAEIGLNPYDLKHFAEWAREDPPPDPEVVASGSNPLYVEHRILARLDDPRLQQFLPVIALLKHFDRDLLSRVVDVGDAFPQLFDRLVDHEWIHQRDTSAIDASPAAEERERIIYAVEEGLRRRLAKHYEDAPSVNLAALADRLWPLLRERTMEWDPARLDPSDFDAALRAIRFRVETGRTWWHAVVGRVVTLRNFDWLAQLTDFLLGDGQAAGPKDDTSLAVPEHPLRGEVLATHAAALYQTGAYSQAASTWLEASDAGAHSLTPAARRLVTRAGLGLEIARPPEDVDQLAAAVESWRHNWDEWRGSKDLDLHLCAAFTGALESIVESAEVLLDSHPDEVRDALAQLELTTDKESIVLAIDRLDVPIAERPAKAGLVSFAWMLIMRTLHYLGQHDDATRSLYPAQNEPRNTDWCDWSLPNQLGDRIQLELKRHGLLTQDVSMSAPTADILSEAYGPDVNRLHALSLEARAREALPVIPKSSNYMQATDVRVLSPAARRMVNAHRLVPPASLVVARLAAEGGQLSDGLFVLSNTFRRSQLLDPEIVLHAERMLATLMARFRLVWRDCARLAQSHREHDRWLQDYVSLTCRPCPDGYEVPPPLFDFARRDTDKSLPARERALQTFARADILGFSSPAKAVPLLDRAADDLAKAQDHVSVFVTLARKAVILASTPALNRKDGARLPQVLAACERSFARIVTQPSIPWGLTQIGLEGITQDWIASLDVWAPWFSRLALCRLRLQRDPAGFTESEIAHLREQLIVQADIAQLLGLRSRAREEARREARVVVTAERNSTAVAEERRPVKTWTGGLDSFALRDAYFSFGPTLVIALLLQMKRPTGFLSWLFAPIEWPSRSFLGMVIFYGVLLLAVFGVTHYGLRAYRRTRTFVLLVVIDGATRAQSMQILCYYDVNVPQFPWAHPTTLTTGTVTMDLPEGESFIDHQVLVSYMPRALGQALTAYQDVARSSKLRIDLLPHGPRARRLAWEAMFAAQMDVEPDRLHVVRQSNAHSRRTSLSASTPADVHVLTHDRYALSTLEAAWPLAKGDRASSRILHVIGDVYGTTGELRVRLDASGTDEDDFADAQSLVSESPMTEIAIVQATLRVQPTYDSRQRSDRLDAENQREFAAQLFDAGIAIVVTLPRLNGPHSLVVVRHLGKAAKQGSRSLGPWLDAVAEARRHLQQELPGDLGRELASEIVLFANDPSTRVIVEHHRFTNAATSSHR